MIKGVLFDMDGVLSDSEPFICKASIMMFSELGVSVEPEDFRPFVGTGENRYIGGVAEKYGLIIDIEKVKARTYEIYTEIIRGSLRPLPGANDFVKACTARGLKIAVATSSDEIKMNANLQEIGLPPTMFQATVNGLEVENKKPAPDIYIRAAAKLELEPAECLVVEDAVSGLRAAKTAGCRCLALTTSFDASQLEGADWICENLSAAPEESITW